jgi:hypothetical protein
MEYFFSLIKCFTMMLGLDLFILLKYLHARDRNGEDFLVPASSRPEKKFPRLVPPRLYFLFCAPTPPRFFKVFLLTVLTPKAAMERIFYSSPHPAPKKVFPASPRPASSFYFSSPPRPAPPRFLAPFSRPVSVSASRN